MSANGCAANPGERPCIPKRPVGPVWICCRQARRPRGVTHLAHQMKIVPPPNVCFDSRQTFTETGDSLLTLRILRPLRLGVCDEFSDYSLKGFGWPSRRRASIAELTRYVSILISSGTDWTNRTKRLAARAPKLDIFADSLVLRDVNGWHITEGGRRFLASLEAPLPITAGPVQAPESDTTKSAASLKLRLVVNNEKQLPDDRQERPSLRSA
jgi:hypothetical protein